MCTFWKLLSISKGFIEIWQLYLAIRAFLERDLSIGLSITLVYRIRVIEIIDSGNMIQSMELNPSPEATVYILLYL
jgi:hypothetical protein